MTVTRESFANTSALLAHIKIVRDACNHDPQKFTDLNIYKSLIAFIADIALSHPELLVRQFQEIFNLEINTKPNISDLTARELFRKLLSEEHIEYLDADDFHDTQKMYDALLDIICVAYGAGLSFGFPMNKGMIEVSRSNMTKLNTDGKPITEDGRRILKGPNFEEPRLHKLLDEAGR